MPTPADLDTNRAVRRVLVKHWIDLGRISVRCIKGTVYIYGHLQRIEGRKEPLAPPTVESIFHAIKHIKGVTTVRPHLENWTNDSGLWRPLERKKNEHPGSAHRPIADAAHHPPTDP